MPTPMVRENFTRLTNIEVGLRAVFMDQLQATVGDSLLNTLFNVQTSTRAREADMGVGGLGDVPEYRGAIEYDSFETLYPATYLHKEYAKGIAIERKLLDDDEYGVMRQRAQMMGFSFDRTIEKHAVSVLENAFSAGAVGPDGVSLAATNHPLSPTDATVQSNRGTSALSYDAIKDTRQAMLRFRDSRGNPINVNPDTLVVPVELEDTARVLVESQTRSGTANNDVNTLRGTYRVIVSRYLTDTNNWFLIDSRMAKLYLNWFWRVRPEFVTDPSSDFELELKFRGYMRYSFGWSNWQFLYGHIVP